MATRTIFRLTPPRKWQKIWHHYPVGMTRGFKGSHPMGMEPGTHQKAESTRDSTGFIAGQGKDGTHQAVIPPFLIGSSTKGTTHFNEYCGSAMEFSSEKLFNLL